MTHQQHLHEERESERQRIEAATEGNVASIGVSHGRAGLMARDNAGRIVLVSLDAIRLRALIAEALEVQRILLSAARIEDEPAPDTKRSCPSSTPPMGDES